MKYFISVAVIVSLISMGLVLFFCNDEDLSIAPSPSAITDETVDEEAEEEISSNETILQVYIHDAPFTMDDKTVEHIYISVERIDIVKEDCEEIITLMDEPQEMDILAITANEPVLLSEVSVEPGTYEQLRLILSEENTVVVDGVEYPIFIPSGTKTGVKFEGPFELPAGQIFKFNMDFDAQESVHWSHGKGYMLKPVIYLSTTNPVEGIFGCYSGLYSFSDPCSSDGYPALISFYDDMHFEAQTQEFDDVAFSGSYYYSSIEKVLTLSDLSASMSGSTTCAWWDLKCKAVKNALENLSDEEFTFDVESWTESIIFTSSCGNSVEFTMIDEPGMCEFEDIPDPAVLTVVVENLDPEWQDMLLTVEVWRSDRERYADTTTVELNGETTKTVAVSVPYWRFTEDSEEFTVAGYIGAEIDGEPTIEIAASSGAVCGSPIFTTFEESPTDTAVLSTSGSSSITIAFPQRMSIWMEPDDWSDSPTFFWTEIPGISKYFFVLSIEDQYPDDGDGTGDCPVPGFPDGDGSAEWDLLIAKVIEGTSYEYEPAPYLLQAGIIDYDDYGDPIESSLETGTLLKLEIHAIEPDATTISYDGTGINSSYYNYFFFGE